MAYRLRFHELEDSVPSKPGIYKIHSLAGMALKVEIGKSLLDRLRDHRASRQSGLKLKANGHWDNPSDVRSKKSILAKHLYYDSSITKDYDLTMEKGRQEFLEEQCYIVFMLTVDMDKARMLEKNREVGENFRYVGDVRKR